MTLSTNVYALDEVSPHELFRFCQTLLAEYDEGRHLPWNQQVCSDAPSTWRGNGAWLISNTIDQNLPAILDVTYNPNGPLRTPEQAAEHDEDCEPDCDGRYHSRACWLDLDFDTAYGATFSFGGCGHLHVLLVGRVGKWLDRRGVRWEWRNEYSGDVHGGEDRYERLIDLVSGSSAAAEWMRTSVLPAIAAQVGAEVVTGHVVRPATDAGIELAVTSGEESDR